MFTKLLRHEWRATRGILGLLCIIVLIAGITIGCTMYIMVSDSRDGATIRIDGTPVPETLSPCRNLQKWPVSFSLWQAWVPWQFAVPAACSS